MDEHPMRGFDFQKHAKAVNVAQNELHTAFASVVDRHNQNDPRTERWITAVKVFNAALARAYPEALREFADGELPASEVSTNMMLDFIEADPVFFRSGYLKEKVLKQLEKRELSDKEAERLRRSIIAVVRQFGGRREFLHYCHVALQVATEAFRHDLEELERSDDAGIQLRANWTLAALEGRWRELRQAARASYPRSAGSSLIAR